MIFKKNILEIASNYDYIICDVWGVIHDGTHSYPLVIDHLKTLRKSGKKLCFLSNAPRRSSIVVGKLESFGVTADLYDFILTSGECTYLFLEENQNNNFQNFKKNYYSIGPEKDIGLLDGLKYKLVTDASKASFVIATGFDNEFSTLQEKLPQLQNAIKYNLPMICANPDLLVVKQTGGEMLCAGVLAEEYKKMGGKVIYFGKPYNLVYEKVFDLFSITDKSKILAVGDGIETDILGANSNNINSALIGGGILSNVLKIKYGELPDSKKIEAVCKKYNIYPKFIIAGL